MNTNQVKLKFYTTIIVLILGLTIIPILIISNQGYIEGSIDEENTDEIINRKRPKISHVYYEDTTGYN